MEYQDEDYLEIENLGLIPAKNGWFYSPDNNDYVDPDGNIRDIEEYNNATQEN